MLEKMACAWARSIKSAVAIGGKMTYLTRFSDAMTLVETALPRACSSMVSWDSKYFLPKKT